MILWAGLIFHLSGISGLRITEAWYDIILRKCAHMFVFGVLALMIQRGLTGSTDWPNNRLLAWSFIATVLYAISDEVHQSFVPERHGSPIDVGIDSVGAAAALLLRIRSR